MPNTLIIGGSKGLGEKLIEYCWDKEHTVYTMSRSTSPALDLNWDGSVIIQEVRKKIKDMGGIDNLIVSSGHGIYLNPIGNAVDVETTVRVNHVGPIYVFRGALKGLITSQGKACMITSTASRRPGSGGLSVYGSAKAGLNGFVLNEGRRAARREIALFAVSPGWFDSPMVEDFTPEKKQKLEENIPFGRFGTTDEIAEFTVSLLGLSNWCLAGQIFECSGGM
jgi:3-oxoacyl-[acyl-carrier protein] reductase